MPALKTVSTPLSKKPWTAIRQAVADLKACEKADGYKINMYAWHNPNGECSVCWAGAVMARRHHEADFGLDDGFFDQPHIGVDIDAQRHQHVGRAGFG